MSIFGVDPGASGSIVMLRPPGWHAQKLDCTERDIWQFIDEWYAHLEGDCFAFIEAVHSSPQMGVRSAFTFGRNYGFLRGIFIARGIAFETVTPQTWQKSLGCLTRGDKNVSKAKAQELFPNGGKITHAFADALLIAEYGRRVLATRDSLRKATT